MHKHLITLTLLGTLTRAGLLPLQERAASPTISRAVLAVAPPGAAGQTDSPQDSQIPDVQVNPVAPLDDGTEYSDQVPFNNFPEDIERQPKQCALCKGDEDEQDACNDIIVLWPQIDRCCKSGQLCQVCYCPRIHEGMGHDPQITSTTAIHGRPSNILPLPKLSSTTSPTDSSCISTAIVTTCHYVGAGHGSVCVENPTCLSWLPINSPPPDTCEDDCVNYRCAYDSHAGCFTHKLGNAAGGMEEESTPEDL